MAGIIHSEYLLAKNKVLASKYLDSLELDIDRKAFLDSSGIKHIYIDESDQTCERFDQLLTQMFDQKVISPDDIDYIIYTNMSSFNINGFRVPFVLKERYGINKATILPIDQACASCLQAIIIGNSLIMNNTAKNVLILSSTNMIDYKDRFISTTILGDGTGILLLCKDNYECEIVHQKSLSDGNFSYHKACHMDIEIDHLRILLGMVNCLQELLKESNLKSQDIGLHIPQSINKYGFGLYASYLDVEKSKIFTENISNGGHMQDVDTIRNYHDAMSIGTIKVGDLFTLWGLGLFDYDALFNTLLLKRVK